MGQGSSVDIGTYLGLDGPRTAVGVRFSVPVQTGPGATQPLVQRTPSLFLGVKELRRCGDHPPRSSAEVKERVELYLYSQCEL